MRARLAFLKPMKTFLIIWAGQFVSCTGTEMTSFGLLVWAYEQSGSATVLALLGGVSYVPYVLASPLAGIVADRWNRRKVMLLADAGAASLSAGLLALLALGRLGLAHLFLYEALTGLLNAFQGTAGDATVTLLVPEEQLGRANGLQSLAASAAEVLAPALAGLVLSVAGLATVLGIDLLTFVAACGTLLAVRIPRPPASALGRAAGDRRLAADLRLGLAYIHGQAGLRALLAVFVVLNLLAALTYFGVLPAMVLARSGGNELALGAVQTALGLGGIIGGLLFSAWGGPRRRASAYLASLTLSFLLGDLLFAVGRGTVVWVLGALGAALTIPFILGCYRAIWQSRVPADVQGRVFAARNALQTAVMPLGFLAGGLLADHLFEPAMLPGGRLAQLFGWLVGTGPGAGMGLMFLGTCAAGTLLGLCGYLLPALRALDEPPARESRRGGIPIC